MADPRTLPADYWSRRKFLTTLGMGAGVLALNACAPGITNGSNGSSDSDGTASDGTASDSAAAQAAIDAVTVQGFLFDESDVETYDRVLGRFTEQTGIEASANLVALDVFRTQLSTYLSSRNPPDALRWLAGSVSRNLAEQGLLLDISDVWTESMADYAPAFKELSTDTSGNQFFVPTDYYWWGVWYRPSLFEENGYEVPETWDEFLALCAQMEQDSIIPLELGTSGSAWMTAGWFDYLNLRVNGAQFHQELLAGQHAFDGPEVRATMAKFAEVAPYINPDSSAVGFFDALTPFFQKQSGMYLIGAFFDVPEDVGDDIDFFRFPIIDPTIGIAEEAPVDGFFAPSGTSNPEGARELMRFISSEDFQQDFIPGGSFRLLANPDVDPSRYSELSIKGRDMISSSESVTQFFNRDSSDRLQETADLALTKFLADPGDVDAILTDWQTQAAAVFAVEDE